ncbi:CocE/NonD family hydrolase [Micromonospora pisi]|uniref:CocE/NonD family hydrolase n=1 Tax=Micromonospora pisi TaxID=589240 RepID=UPI001B861085|nr:CocE/NonD family hydrolase [Micromonospora pisi]
MYDKSHRHEEASHDRPRHIRVLRRLGRREVGPHQVGYSGRVTVPAADGTPLLADHYQPLTEGDFPTLLIRSPYGRGFPFASLFGFAYASHGFHVVLQSCRGTGGSAGEFTWWLNETDDGLAAVAWLREQPWFSGDFGMVGLSYLAYVQWAMAMDPPPELRALVVQVGAHDPYSTAYPGGAFALENSVIAAVSMVHQGRGALRFVRALIRLQRKLPSVVRSLPIKDAYVPAVGQRVPYIDGLLGNPDRDAPFWHGTDIGATAERLEVPTKVIAGWHDLLLDQNLQQYARLRGAGCPTSLLIGPWTHTSMLEVDGPMVLAESVAWLRAHISGDRSGLRESRVRVHVGGVDEWRDLADWPPPAVSRALYPTLGAGELGAEAGDDAGRLADTPPEASEPVGSFRYDPANPTPSIGGPLLSRTAGVRDNTELEARPDVLTFTTGALSEPLEVIGPVSVELWVAAKAGSNIDIFARLCDVDESGCSRNICDGLFRLPAFTSDDPVAVTVGLSSTAHRFRHGHRVRLQISGGAHPRFARNTGSGEPAATATRLVATDVTIHPGSVLRLPQVT